MKNRFKALFGVMTLSAVLFAGCSSKSANTNQVAGNIDNIKAKSYVITPIGNDGTVTVEKKSYRYGEKAVLTATADDGFRFYGWSVDGRIISKASTLSYAVHQDTKIEAIFLDNSKVSYVFEELDVSGEFYANTPVENVMLGQTPFSVIGRMPNYVYGKLVRGWSTPVFDGNIATVRALYEVDYALNKTVVINGRAATYHYGEEVVAIATDPKFNHWADANGNVISYNPIYKFNAYGNMTILQANVPADPAPTITQTACDYVGGLVTCAYTIGVPVMRLGSNSTEYGIEETGLVLSSSALTALGNAKKYEAAKVNPNGQFVISVANVPDVTNVYVTGYVAYYDSELVLKSNLTASTQALASESLAIEKSDAVLELSGYAASKGYIEVDYTTGNWTTLTGFVTSGTTAINKADTPDDVASALQTAKAGMDGVASLRGAKDTAISSLEDYRTTFIDDLYDATGLASLTKCVTDGKTNINAARTTTAINDALGTAKSNMDKVTKKETVKALNLTGFSPSGAGGDFWLTWDTAGVTTSNATFVVELTKLTGSTYTATTKHTDGAQKNFFYFGTGSGINILTETFDLKLTATVGTEKYVGVARISAGSLLTLAQARTAAITELTTYLGTLVEIAYYASDWAILQNMVKVGSPERNSIENAQTFAAIDDAKTAVLKAMKDIQPKPFDVETARSVAKIDLNAYYQTFDQADYSGTGLQALQDGYNNGIKAIDDANTQSEIDTALLNAKAAIVAAISDVTFININYFNAYNAASGYVKIRFTNSFTMTTSTPTTGYVIFTGNTKINITWIERVGNVAGGNFELNFNATKAITYPFKFQLTFVVGGKTYKTRVVNATGDSAYTQ